MCCCNIAGANFSGESQRAERKEEKVHFGCTVWKDHLSLVRLVSLSWSIFGFLVSTGVPPMELWGGRGMGDPHSHGDPPKWKLTGGFWKTV